MARGWDGHKLSDAEVRKRRAEVIAYLVLGVILALVLTFCDGPQGGADDGCPDGQLMDTCVPTHQVCDVIEGERVCYEE